jgi:hypothetical protein
MPFFKNYISYAVRSNEVIIAALHTHTHTSGITDNTHASVCACPRRTLSPIAVEFYTTGKLYAMNAFNFCIKANFTTTTN